MHNSLFIRDLLRKTNSDPLRLERRDPHRDVAPDPSAAPGPGEFGLRGPALVPDYADRPRQLIAADLRDFLARMGVRTAAGDAAGSPAIAFEIAPELGARNCRRTMSPERILVEGGDVAGLWAGLAWLEWDMRTRRGPILPASRVEHRAAWPVQISQGPWGSNYSVPDFAPEYLSDDGFRLYAHYGVNSMMIYGDLLCYAGGDVLPELNVPEAEANLAILKDAASRAAAYGVQFSYVVVGPKLRPDHPVFVNHPGARGTGVTINGRLLHFLCSSDEDVLAFYRQTFSRLFAEAPELAGVILIVSEESFYHCKMWRMHATAPCPRCAPKTTEQAIADLLAVIDGAVRSVQPRAWVAAWPYTTNQWERPDRVEFIRALPEGVAFCLAIDKDQMLRKDGYTKHVWDYSVDFIGPSDDIRLTARVAHATGHPLFLRTETGIGLEVFQFPYVPAMQRLADKWQNVRRLRPYGVHQAWLFFGMFGSRAEELGLWAAYRPDMPRDTFLRRIAERDFGPGAADLALEAWQHLSEAVGHLPCVCLSNYYTGPSYLGPCHPLVPQRDAPIPDVFYRYQFYLQELEETFSRSQIEDARVSMVMDRLPDTARAVGMSWDGPSDGWDIAIREYTIAATEAESAWRLLLRAGEACPTPADYRRLREEQLLAEAVYRTFRACENTLRFLQARRDFEGSSSPESMQEMRRVAALERDNAVQARPIYRQAPWLDLAERTDGKFAPCADMIDAKVAWIDAFLAG